MRHTNIIGNKYNKLTVLQEIKIKTKNRVRHCVICKCDCGNIKQIEKSKVVSGNTKSCGCLYKESIKKWADKNALPMGESAFNEVYNAYKRSAEKRNYDFKLTKEYFKEIVTQPCVYCG